MIISTDVNFFDKIQKPFMLKTPRKPEHREIPRLEKEYLQKPTANVVLKGQGPSASP